MINFMKFIAQELREYMARLGVRTVDELVGRSEFLKKKEVTANPRASRIDLSAVLNHPYSAENNVPGTYDFELEKTLDETVLLQELGEKLKKGMPGEVNVHVKNTNRTFGTCLGPRLPDAARKAWRMTLIRSTVPEQEDRALGHLSPKD